MPKLRTTGSDGGGGDANLIPEGEVVEARVMGVDPNSFNWDGEMVHKLRWAFAVTEDPWKNKTVRGDTSTNFTPHPNCKAYSWSTAITGQTYQDGDELDTDDLVGLKARIIIGHEQGKDGNTYMRVRDVLPSRSRLADQAQATPSQTGPDEAPF